MKKGLNVVVVVVDVRSRKSNQRHCDPFQADLYAGQLVLLEATQSRTTSTSSIVAILFCLGIATIYTLSGTYL